MYIFTVIAQTKAVMEETSHNLATLCSQGSRREGAIHRRVHCQWCVRERENRARMGCESVFSTQLYKAVKFYPL